MDIAIRWHRLLRALAFLAGGLVFSIAIIFIFSNLTPIEVHWRIPATVGYTYDLTFKGVNTWLLAILPLLAGALIGYFYQTPARMHHVREALRHRHRVHELEHELKEVRKSLDKVLGMPQDSGLAVPATLLDHREVEAEDDAELDPRLPDEPAAVALLGAGPSAKPAAREVRATRARKPAEGRKGLLGGLKAEIAGIHLPGSIPATVVARPRRNGKTTNGADARRPAAAEKPAVAKAKLARQVRRPVRGKEARKPS